MSEYDLYLWLAGVSTALFTIKTTMLLMGADLEFEDGGLDFDDLDVDGTEAFNMFSLQSILAFFMLFGWSSLAFRFESGLSTLTATPLAVLTGLVGAVTSAYLLKLTKKLNSKPLPATPSVGATGKVYLPLRPGGVGQVILTHNGADRVFRARNASGEKLSQHDSIKVVDNSNSVLIVEPYGGN